MKRIPLHNNWFFAFVVIAMVVFCTAANNYFFYKNQEKVNTSRFKDFSEQIKISNNICLKHSSSEACYSSLLDQLSQSKISGTIQVTDTSGKTILNVGKSRENDNRTSVSVNSTISNSKTPLLIHFEKKTTPPLYLSVVRSLTFSIADWQDGATSYGRTAFDTKKFANFIEYIVIPRSAPAFTYLLIIWLAIFFFVRRQKSLMHEIAQTEKLITTLQISKKQLEEQHELLSSETEKLSEQLYDKNKETELLDHSINDLCEKNKLANQELKKAKQQQAEISQLKVNAEKKVNALKKEFNNGLINNQNVAASASILATQLLQAQQELEHAYSKNCEIEKVIKEKLETNELLSIELIEKNEELVQSKTLIDSLNVVINNKNDELRNNVQKQSKTTQLINNVHQEQEKLDGKSDDLGSKKRFINFLIDDPQVTLSPEIIRYNSNDHHSKDFVTGVFRSLQENHILKQLVVSVHSGDFAPRSRRKLIVERDLKLSADNIVLRICADHDAGYVARVVLSTTNKWEAILQAKAIKLAINRFKHFEIVDSLER